MGDLLQPTHLLFVLVVALLVLGPKRLPEAGRALGRGLRDFRSAISGEEPPEPAIPPANEPPAPHVPEPAAPATAEPAQNPDPLARAGSGDDPASAPADASPAGEPDGAAESTKPVEAVTSAPGSDATP